MRHPLAFPPGFQLRVGDNGILSGVAPSIVVAATRRLVQGRHDIFYFGNVRLLELVDVHFLMQCHDGLGKRCKLIGVLQSDRLDLTLMIGNDSGWQKHGR